MRLLCVADDEDDYGDRKRDHGGPHIREIRHLIREDHAHRVKQRCGEGKYVVESDQCDTGKPDERNETELRALRRPAYHHDGGKSEKVEIGVREFSEFFRKSKHMRLRAAATARKMISI